MYGVGKTEQPQCKRTKYILYHIQKSTQNGLKISIKPENIKFIEKI